MDSEPSNDSVNMTAHNSVLECQLGNEEQNEVLNQEITKSEINQVIKGLKSRKPSGLDGIQNEILISGKCNSLLKYCSTNVLIMVNYHLCGFNL